MASINCPKCGKEIDNEVFFCPYCNFPIEEKEEDIEESEIEEVQKQNGFGIAAFILAVITLAFTVSRYFITGWLAPVMQGTLQILKNIICIVAFMFGTVGMFMKNRKSGFAIAGNIMSFLLLFV